MIEKLSQNNIISETFQSEFQKQIYLIKSELLSLRLNWKWSLLIVLVSPLSVLFFYIYLWEKIIITCHIWLPVIL